MASKYSDVSVLAGFSLVYGIHLVAVLLWTFRKRMPYIELLLASMAIQLLIAPFLEYHYYYNEIFGVMHVTETAYFEFVTFAILALETGLIIFNKQLSEHDVFTRMKADVHIYEKLGIKLIVIGYIFYLINLFNISLGFAFIIKTFTYLRFIGLFYLICSSSKKTLKYTLLIFIPFLLETLKVAIFIEFFIISIWTVSILFLKRKISPIFTASLVILGLFFAIILQSVKHQYRELKWGGKEVSLTKLMLNQQSKMDADQYKVVGAIFNVRVNQGWIVSDVIEHTSRSRFIHDGKYLRDETIGILLPRLLYPSKPIVGSHEKFDKFVGWHLDKGTAMNLGLMGDAYGNLGSKKGIVFIFGFGLLIGFGHRKYQNALVTFPDLLCWAPLFYNYLIRAGNEYYIITNWYVKTGFVTLLFFYFVRKRMIQSNQSPKHEIPSPTQIAPDY